MKDYFSVMPPATAALFSLLQNSPLLKQFILVGGTGLALHIGHRKSEDLDFITCNSRLPRGALKAVEEILRNQGFGLVHQDDPTAYDDFDNAGMDLRDYSQNWLIDGSVKLTFFTAENHRSKILTEPGNQAGFRIGTFPELCQLKSLVAASRSKSRDWMDLYVLDRDHGFGLPQWKESYDKAGLTSSHFETALNRICSGTVSTDDPGLESLMQAPPALSDIVEHFRQARRNYETGVSRAALMGQIHQPRQPTTTGQPNHPPDHPVAGNSRTPGDL